MCGMYCYGNQKNRTKKCNINVEFVNTQKKIWILNDLCTLDVNLTDVCVRLCCIALHFALHFDAIISTFKSELKIQSSPYLLCLLTT